MKFSKIRQIVQEELQRFVKESMWDAYYAKMGIDPSQRYPNEPKPEPQAQQQPITSTKGEFVGKLTTSWNRKLDKPIAVYKNPESLAGFDTAVSAVLVAKSLDLYVAEKKEGMHQDLVLLLAEKGIIPQSSLHIDRGGTPKYFEYYPSEFMAMYRIGNSSIFAQGAMYDAYPPQYEDMIKKANEKFTGIKFSKGPLARTGR